MPRKYTWVCPKCGTENSKKTRTCYIWECRYNKDLAKLKDGVKSKKAGE